MAWSEYIAAYRGAIAVLCVGMVLGTVPRAAQEPAVGKQLVPAPGSAATQALGQQAPAAPALPPANAAAGLARGPGMELDRVVAVVNGDLVLESDVEEERRLSAFQPVRGTGAEFSRAKAIDRLIDRMLILQQARIQQEDEASNQEVQTQLLELRKEIPACQRYQCETEAGWQRFVTEHGFTMEELTNRWRERMEVLRFIEMRFRMGIHIPETDVAKYYEMVMLPEYAKEGVRPPLLRTVAPRIEEVLLQEQVSALLDDWLKSLRAQGSVRILQPGEEAP